MYSTRCIATTKNTQRRDVDHQQRPSLKVIKWPKLSRSGGNGAQSRRLRDPKGPTLSQTFIVKCPASVDDRTLHSTVPR